MADIHCILTGGTIDSQYNPPRETASPNPNSVIPEYIDTKIKPHPNVTYDEICMLDSSDITNDIRDQICERIQKSAAQNIIISHGTNTMVETLNYLAKRLPDTNKTIVL